MIGNATQSQIPTVREMERGEVERGEVERGEVVSKCEMQIPPQSLLNQA